ncbi:MAG: hypothetical protein JSW08_01910 [archaeon]|nr:MAG: hypothetical protein JSW08_01910 [archaeon]
MGEQDLAQKKPLVAFITAYHFPDKPDIMREVRGETVTLYYESPKPGIVDVYKRWGTDYTPLIGKTLEVALEALPTNIKEIWGLKEQAQQPTAD